jgi:hypothetical protein
VQSLDCRRRFARTGHRDAAFRHAPQEIDFSRIGGFESMSSRTVRTGSPPKMMVDDYEQHAIFLMRSHQANEFCAN